MIRWPWQKREPVWAEGSRWETDAVDRCFRTNFGEKLVARLDVAGHRWRGLYDRKTGKVRVDGCHVSCPVCKREADRKREAAGIVDVDIYSEPNPDAGSSGAAVP